MARATGRTGLHTAAYVAVAAVDSVLAAKTTAKARRLRYLTKPALMPLLNAATRDARGEDVLVRRGLTAAQALSWAGDVALLGRGERAFLAGLGAFLGAHVAYVTTFGARRGRLEDTGTAGLTAAAGMLLAVAPTMALAARRREPALAGPVAAYATVLAAMVATGSTLDPRLSAAGRRAVRAGTVLFLVSDTLLGAGRFLLRDEHPALEGSVMATYTAGQALIAIGATHL